MTVEQILRIALIVVAVIIGLTLKSALSQYRRRSIRDVAEEMDYAFNAEDDGSLLEKLKAFPLYTRGYDRVIANVLRKHINGFDVSVFDYNVSTYSPRRLGPSNSIRKDQTVVLFETRNKKMPDLEIHSGQNNPALSNEFHEFFKEFPGMSIESNENGIIIYEYQIKHPPEDLHSIMLQRIRLLELIIEQPVHLASFTNESTI